MSYMRCFRLALCAINVSYVKNVFLTVLLVTGLQSYACLHSYIFLGCVCLVVFDMQEVKL